tara:strand:+ start:125 stop:463 length:339 start_codon:yes stop_codon:yes gene_type:complete
MKINKLISAIGNIKQIAEGVKNKIFKNEDVEAIAKLRWQKCTLCSALDNKGIKCAVKGTAPCCADCGCSLGFKLRALSSECPRKKWPAIMDPASEKLLKQQIKESEEDANNI